MPDPQAPAIAFWYVKDNTTLEELCAFLIRKGEWFDVRRPVKYKWSICFNAIVEPPKVLAKRLTPVPDTPRTGHGAAPKSLASYKADRKKMMRGKR